jgi:hypothetical protein
MTARVQLKKSLIVSIKGLGSKTNWLAVNRQPLSNSDSDSDSESQSEELVGELVS